MQKLIKSNAPEDLVKELRRYMTFFVFVAFVAVGIFAKAAPAIPEGWESYLSRPDVLSMTPQNAEIKESDTNLIKAHFSFIAFLLEAYPADTKIYFLARDSENLFDVARLVTKGTADANRFHLLNVSRGNMHDANLVPYLKENGIWQKD